MSERVHELAACAQRHARRATVLAWVSVAFAVIAVFSAVMGMVAG